MRRGVHILVVAALLVVSASARGDYVQVQRSAILRAGPDRRADALARLAPRQVLALVRPLQMAGYYRVADAAGQEGWVYRTFVRRYVGAVPPSPELDGALTVGAVTTRTDDELEIPRDPLSLARSQSYAGLPRATSYPNALLVLTNCGYSVGYDEARKNPAWATYRVHAFTRQATPDRPGFRADRRTQSRVASGDYTNSGYARGHMAPNYAIFQCFGVRAQVETFLTSNVAPQYQRFNGGVWEALEDIIANRYAQTLGEVWVTCGPLYEAPRDPLRSGIAVPSGFYLIIVDDEAGKPRALAFRFRHVNGFGDSPESALSSIDDVEQATGLDFFGELEDATEAALEAAVAAELWPYNEEDRD
jgi:DNA/RNA endonuclease G (NUC1)